MTNVIIHGILAKKFGKLIKIRLGNIKSVVSAIDSMKRGFRKELCELFHEKVYYEIVINKDALNEIHFIPCILGFGSGGGGWKILGYVLMVVAVILTIASMGAFAPVTTAMSTWLFVGSLVVSTLGTLASVYGTKLEMTAKINALFAQLASQMKVNSSKKDTYAGGGTKLIGGAGSSYLFSNEVNFNTQGQIVRLGYGKVKTGTNTIGVSIKSVPMSVSLEDHASSTSNSVIRLYD